MIRLASMPMPHITNVAQSVLKVLASKQSPDAQHRPIPAPEPNPEPNPAPDAPLASSQFTLSPVIWDELFDAVLIRLEGCVDEAVNDAEILPVPQRSDATKIAVHECIEAMKQLHKNLTLERQSHEKHQLK